ncbi:MAG: hypothetical protein A2068_05365 [Ignavibacteria bacterium GWB2_35_6b]|nr:MAG: hypothetical protein A2068_05365 [Ignavibacteria bacterium GWB2_35_6b]
MIKKENKTKVNLKLTPLISICVPTYNQAHLIKDGLQSAINQTYQNIEIIVVDDGSEDNTKEIVNSFQSSKIKYVFKEHTNAADTRNKAIKEAKGEFIFWLDSDDVLDLRIIEEYIAVYNNYPDADIFYSNLYCIDLTGKLLHLFEYEDYYNNNQKMIQFLFKGQPIPNPGTMINKKVFDVTGLFNTEFKRAHDYEFFTRLVLLNKFKTKHINKLMYTYRIHENNITLNTSGKINFEFERKIFNTLISQNDLKIFFPDIDWNTNPAAAQTVVNLKIGLRFYELEGYEEATIYLKKFFEVDRDEKNFIDLINKFANDGNFIQAKNLIDNLNGVSKFFPNYTQIKSIIDEAVFHAQIEEN